MLPGIEMLACPDMAVPMEVMQHVIDVESSRNPYAIGVVGGTLQRQPRQLDEALATVRMLEEKGYNFSLGLAQVNRYNLAKYGLDTYEKAFQQCPNLQAGSRILAECHGRSGQDWGKSFSCYYSGNFTTGFRQGYVQKVFASIARQRGSAAGAGSGAAAIALVESTPRRSSDVPARTGAADTAGQTRLQARVRGAAVTGDTPQVAQAVVADDPARAYTVYPSAGAMVRGALLGAADAALSQVLTGGVDGPPAANGAAAPPPLDAPQPASTQAATAPADSQAPVRLRPWSQRNTPQAMPAQAPAGAALPPQDIPGGDSAFVF